MNCRMMFRGVVSLLCVSLAGQFAAVAGAAEPADGSNQRVTSDVSEILSGRSWPIWSAYRDISTMRAIFRATGEPGGALAGSCPPQIVTHSDANFGGGSFIVQAGFAETEVAAASYVVSAASFPIRLDLTEMIFATSAATVQTTTKWSIMIWEGTPATGTLVFSYSSDAKVIPHIVLPPGTTGVNVQFMVDPGDPEQIYINDNGSHTFSVGYRIDDHNNQTQNPCFFSPPSSSNAFPTTDTGGLQQPSQNWLYMVNCGALGCGVGWKTFAQLPTACRPSGDWVIRATYTPVNCAAQQGACCIGTGCAIATAADCASAGGAYRGDGSICNSSICFPQGNNACCFSTTGGCISLSYQNCLAAGGAPGPEGSLCATYVCFPTGACCKPDGTCGGSMSPTACAAQGGTYQGNGSTCTTATCPMPQGAACFPSGFCLIMSQADAVAAGANWRGVGTTCADSDGNGTADACQIHPGDLNGDQLVNGLDLATLLSAWGSLGGIADINHDEIVNGGDLAALLSDWTG